MEQSSYMEVQEEIVTPDTTYMCGACFEFFPSLDNFNNHECPAAGNENNNDSAQVQDAEESRQTCTVVQQDGDLEKDVANILGEMKYTVPSRAGFQSTLMSGDDNGGVMQDQTYIINYEVEPSQDGSGISNLVEQKIQYDVETVINDPLGGAVGVEIPSSCLFPYENPAYLNRLMKDNTVGKRVRHDAPYTHRLGPWDDVSTKLLIKYVREVPAAYFIANDNVKRTEAWELIRNKLSESDHHFTVLQIRMRWRELCKKYRNVINYNELNGGGRISQYFEELNDLFGVWDRQATEILIRELSGKNLKQNGGLRMRFNTWDKIRTVLFENGYGYTAHQVHGRWNALVTLYQRMVARRANPNFEPFEMAYKELVQPLLPYVCSKKEKPCKDKSKDSKDKWTPQMERALLQVYIEHIEDFRKSEIRNNREIWTKIAERLNRDHGFTVSIEKARVRFYELSKYYSSMLRYNSQQGALHRECKYHDILASIYNRYNLWPHDGSTIKYDNSSARRMRQLNAQLRWSEEESRAVLLLYPQVLTDHLQSTEQQPLEELWVEMAKGLLAVKSIQKLPYEIEEHIVLLRRGFKSKNPFPFYEEMEELEETEHSLCFSPEESPSTDTVQLIPYWSHHAACLLLDYIRHYRQEGVKTLNDCMYEIISADIEYHGFSYTGKECRQYYLLLRKIFKNKIQSMYNDEKDVRATFPYYNRMMDLKSLFGWQGGFEDSSDSRLKILESASTQIKEIEEDEDMIRQMDLEKNLTRLKIFIMNNEMVHPPPSIKNIAKILLKFMRNEYEIAPVDPNTYFGKLREILDSHMDILAIVAEKGVQRSLEKSQQEGKNRLLHKSHKINASVNWKDENIQTLLTTVKESCMLCHDEAEVESVLAKGQSLWEEVAYKLSRMVKKCPSTCKDFFDMLCYDHLKEDLLSYHNDPTEEDLVETPLQTQNKELLKSILSPLVAHDAEWDSRDVFRSTDEEGWSAEEILELLFTVRELLNEDDSINWDQVQLMMLAGGFERSPDRYHMKFIDLYNEYKKAYNFNKDCTVKARRRPPFYFKIHTLFGYKVVIKSCKNGTWTPHSVNQEAEEDVIEMLLLAFKERKNLFCHMVPRLPLLNSLSTYMEDQYEDEGKKFSPNLVWHLLVQLHNAQAGSISSSNKGPFGRDLDGLWQNHPNPLVAYGLQSIPTSGWQWVKNWSVEELSILTDSFIQECLPDNFKTREFTKIPNIFLYQLGYMLSTFKHGGYEAFEKQLNLVYMLQKWSNIVLNKRSPILQKLRENYLKIESSKGILRSGINTKFTERSLADDDFLYYFSEDSDDVFSFTESDLDSSHEVTDTDEEHAENMEDFAIHKGDLNSNFRMVVSPKVDKSHKNSVGHKNTTIFSPIKKSPGKSDVKYVFKVTTSQQGAGEMRIKRHSENESDKSPRMKASSMTNFKGGSPGKSVQVSLQKDNLKDKPFSPPSKVQFNVKPKTISNKRKIVFEGVSPAKKQIISKGSPLKMGNASGNIARVSKGSPLKMGNAAGNIISVSKDSKAKTPNPSIILEKASNSLLKETESVQRRTPTKDIKPVNEALSEKRIGKVSSPKKKSEIDTSGNAKLNKDKTDKARMSEEVVAQSRDLNEEENKALVELTNQYYERRKQEKDRLLTAFNSAQESYQKQASALLQMFDNLQNLL